MNFSVDKDKRIQELESKIEVLVNDNSKLVEDREDSLFLGAISELVNDTSEIGVVLKYSLERISLLKGLPFCAYGVRLDHKYSLKRVFFSLLK